MREASLTVLPILDAAARTTVRVASPWMGVLWLTTLPLRLLQLYFTYQLYLLGEPQFYLYYLWKVAAIVFAAFVVSLYGRAVFVRACNLSSDTLRSSRLAPLKVPLSDFIPYVYASLFVELLFFAGAFTVICSFPLLVVGGLIAAASYGIGGPKLIDSVMAPFKILWGRPIVTLSGLATYFFVGLLMSFWNLYATVIVLVMLLAPYLEAAAARWMTILKPELVLDFLPLYPELWLPRMLLLIGASMIVEPFWLAANVDLIQKARARKSGEDMKLWFQDLKNEAAS